MKTNWKKNAVFFLFSQAISLFGSALVQYAITWHITLTAKSGLYVTIAVAAGFLPTMLLSPFAGVWADRYDRKRLIVLADGAIAFFTLVLAVVFMMGYREMWLLFVVLALRAFGGAVQGPSVNAMLPDIVPRENLDKVNGINTSLQSFINLVSPLASGVLMGFAALEVIFFVDIVTATIAIVIMLFLVKLEKEPAHLEQLQSDFAAELKAGLQYIKSTPWLRNFFFILVFFFLAIGPVAMLTPLQIARNYGDNVKLLTIMETIFSAGMILGGIAMALWGGFSNRIKTMSVASVFMGVLTLGLGVPLSFPVYVTVMGLFGFAMPMCNTQAMVLLQEKTDPAYMGRVFSILSMISGSITPLGMMIFGPLADVVPIEWILLFTGAGIIAISIAFYANKPLRLAGKKEPAR